jgi:hypothetical protein
MVNSIWVVPQALRLKNFIACSLRSVVRKCTRSIQHNHLPVLLHFVSRESSRNMETAQKVTDLAVEDGETGRVQDVNISEAREKIQIGSTLLSLDTKLHISSQLISAYQHPKNWPRAKKWTLTLILSAFAFLQPLSETMLAHVEAQISRSPIHYAGLRMAASQFSNFDWSRPISFAADASL